MYPPGSPLRLWIFPTLIFIVYFTAVVSASRELSPAVDEPLHIRSGMAQLTHGMYIDDAAPWWSKPDPLHPPIDMLPALVAKLAGQSPDFRSSPWIAPHAITAARSVNHIFGALLLIVTFLFGRALWGYPGGVLAMVLLALNPLFLGHASIVSSDLTAAFGGALAAFAIWRAFLRNLNWMNFRSRIFWLSAIFPGIAIGFSIICKVSNLLFIAVACVVIVIAGLRMRKTNSKWLLYALAATAATSLAAIFLAAAVYRFTGVYREPFSLFGRTVHLGFFNDLAYCANYALSLGEKLPSPVYYKGWFQPPSPRHYLAAFIYKTPVPLLILLGLGCAIAGFRARFQKHRGVLFLFAVVTFMAAYFTTRGFYLGLRHMLLPIVLLTILAAAAVTRVPRWGFGRNVGFLQFFLSLLLVLTMIRIAVMNPWWIGSSNELARKRLILVDSDQDWGQGLIALAEWQQQNSPGDPIWLSYFGSVRPEDYGVNYRGLLSPFSPGMTLDPEWEKGRDPEQLNGWVAVSATQLAGTFMGHVGQPANYYEKWLGMPTAAKIAGGSIWIYDCRRNH